MSLRMQSLGQHGQHLPKGVERIFHGDGVDDQFGLELAYLIQRGEAARVVDEAQLQGVGVVDGCLVLEAQYIGKEGAHLSGSEDEDAHK